MYELAFTPRINEVNIRGKLQFPAIINYFQHIAYKHAHELGVVHEQLFPKGLTWLLLRYTVEVIRYPHLDEVLKVSSWVAESGSPKYTIRDFEVVDENSNIVCKATTSWLLFNYRKRKSVNFMDYWPDFKAEKRRALDYDFPGLPLPKNINTKKSFKVRKQDLDINQHVNHIAHIHWIMEGMPEKVVKKYELERFEISYKEQGFYEDDILVETEILKEKDNGTLEASHQTIKGKKEKLVSKAVTSWRSIK